MLKRTFDGAESSIRAYSFKLFGKTCIIALSGTAWHENGKYPRFFIRFTNKNKIPTIIIGKLAVGIDNRPINAEVAPKE